MFGSKDYDRRSVLHKLVLNVDAVCVVLILGTSMCGMIYEEMNAPFVAETVMLLRVVLGKLVCMVFG